VRAWRIKTARGALDLRQFAGTLAYFSGMLRAHATVLSIAFVATIAATLMALAAPWPVKVVLDQVILGHPAKGWLLGALNAFGGKENLLVLCAAAVVVIAVLQGVFEYTSEILQAQTAHRISNTLRRRLFKHLQTLSLGFHERNRTGDLLLRLTGDITMVRELLVESMFDLAAAALTVIGLLIVMAQMAPTLTLLSLMTLPAVAILSMVMSIRLRSVVRKAREKEGDLISIAGEVLSAMALVQAFTREEEEKERFSRLGRSALRAGLKSVRIQSRLNRSVQFVTAIGTCAILYLGVQEVTAGRMTPGMLIVFMAYFNNLLKPIRQVARIAAKIAKASSCADRVRSVLDTEPEIRDRPDAVAAPAFSGRVTYDNLAFEYAKGRQTLRDISLDILPGQRVALVGPTGAGKSTLVKLLLRFYDPTSGAVRIDGRDIREFTLESLRGQISVVQQETVLFGTTIEENIAMGRAGATLDDVRAAAAALDLDDWLTSLPKGYKTPVGERGITLSGGQRQLIALARAVLRGGRILIFDEPTTGLDGQTEMRIRASLRRAMRDRTTILISHGARPLADVDRIVVLSGGRIVQSGQAQDLAQSAGVYRELFGIGNELPRIEGAAL